MFDIKEPLTLENVLSKVSEYDIFKAYCPNFKEVDKKFVAELNRSKKEDYPSANITYYKGKLWYKDFGNSDKAMDCFSYIQAKYNLSFVQALSTVNLDFNLGLQSYEVHRPSLNYIGLPDIKFFIKEKESTIIRPKFRQWLKRDVEYWAVEFSILKPTLELYGVKPVQWYLLNDKFIQCENLAYSYLINKEKGVNYYKIYSPLSKSFKWITNCKSNQYQGLNQLKQSGELLIITKSLKDVMELYQLGYSSIAPANEAVGIDEDFMQSMKSRFNEVILLYDNDDAGIKGANRISLQHDIRSVIIPYEYGTKDLSDTIKLYGADKGREIMKGLLGGE